jgi:hypothetical protein
MMSNVLRSFPLSAARREPALQLLTRFWVDVARSDSAKQLDRE